MENTTTFLITRAASIDGSSITDVHGGGIVSKEVVYWFHVLMFFGVNCPISLLGMCANIINISVFLRQGILSDSSNTTLLGLAFADFWCLLTIFLTGLFFFIFQEGPQDRNWDPQGVMLMTAGWPHVMFSQIACWITAYLAFERCICVSYPFKVKTLFSAKRSLFVISFIFTFTIACYCPVYATHTLNWVDIPEMNQSIFTIKYMPHWKVVGDTSNYFNSLIMRTASILVVMVCTKITVFKVNSSKKWRQSVASSSVAKDVTKSTKTHNISHKAESKTVSGKNSNCHQDSNAPSPSQKSKATDVMSEKDTRMVRMVTIICFIFLICYTPDIVMVFTRSAIDTLHFGAKHHNLMMLLYWGSFFTESINSSINILVYYRLSSRYRQHFRGMFGLE